MTQIFKNTISKMNALTMLKKNVTLNDALSSHPITLYFNHYKNIIAYINKKKNRNQDFFYSRMPKLVQFVFDNKYFRYATFKLAIIIEPIISLTIVTALLFPFVVLSIVTRKKSISNKLYLSYAILLKRRVEVAGLYSSSIDWLYPIFLPASMEKVTGKNVHSVFEYVNVFDVLKAYVYSIFTILFSVKVLCFKNLFRNYVCFEYFLTAIFLRNISSDVELSFANQIDRWAILFDHAPQKNKILFQHGIEMPEADWPIKLKNITMLYALSKNESIFLTRATVVGNPIIKILPPTIQLTDCKNSDKKSVLIVGYPAYGLFEKESELICKIDLDKVDLYLKIHPGKQDLVKYEELQKKRNYILITNNTFPNVGIVVSYRSTLAVEYEVYNKRVMLYNDYSIEQICEIINK